MRVDEAEGRLRQLLDAEFGGSKPDPRTTAQRAWGIYKAFAAEPMDVAVDDPDRDMVIFSFGTHDWEDGRCTANLVLIRQFVLNDESGDYDHLEHLHCHLYTDLKPEFEGLGEQGIFLPPATHLDEWIRDVEGSAGFKALVAAPASHVFVAQEHV